MQLTATAIKDARGKPVGLTEVLQVPQLEGSLEQIALAAFGRLCVPFHGPLSAQVKTNLNLQRDAIAAIQDLGSLGAVVRDGGTGGDLEAAARRINLDELLAVCEALITRSRTASQELQASASDLRTLSSGMKSTSPFVLRWNELVDRCLHALRFHRETPPEVNCSYGDSGRVTAAGSVVVPLVLSLLEGALASGDRVTITTSASDSEVHLSVEPGLRAGPALSRVRLLAMEAGGDLDGDGGDATKTTLRLPSLDPHANPYESTTQRGRLSFQSESTTGPQPRGGENQPSDSGDTAEMANEKGAVRNIDDLDETQSELPALGKNNSVVEVVGQMTPGLTRKWGGDMGPDEPGEAGPTAEAKAKASEKSKAKPKAKAKEGKKKRSRKARAKKGVKSE